MTVPLVVLAFFAAIAGVLNLPFTENMQFLDDWLEPVIGQYQAHLEESTLQLIVELADLHDRRPHRHRRSPTLVYVKRKFPADEDRAAVLLPRLVHRPRRHRVHGRPRPQALRRSSPCSTGSSSTAPSTASGKLTRGGAVRLRHVQNGYVRGYALMIGHRRGPAHRLRPHPGVLHDDRGHPRLREAPRRRVPAPARPRARPDPRRRCSSRCSRGRGPSSPAWSPSSPRLIAGALSICVLVEFKTERPRLPVRGLPDLGVVARHQVLPRRRRHLAVPRRAHRHPVPDRAVRGQARPRREGLLRLAHPARWRAAWACSSSLDLFLFFLLFELTLVPLYFLIGRWGHGRRVYAATKFFLYTMLGSAFMLVSIVVARGPRQGGRRRHA